MKFLNASTLVAAYSIILPDFDYIYSSLKTTYVVFVKLFFGNGSVIL